ncbi:MAG: aminotransferase class I/II-fold pyridoxal phosphate-dependent enzyme [Myxococcaceae bacterium]|nr:aminotransferase class I/II-fold pyridoxal phosphate-dependent enzyme [Myxococcaceae bacterium]
MPDRIYLSPPHMGPDERSLLLDAFDSNWIAPLGPHVEAFEKELAARVAVPHAAALSSGTAALHLALQLVGVGRGDDVVVSSLTFAASANPVTYLGARPVFIDSETKTWNLDPDLLEEELEARRREGRPMPKAVVVVDLYGQCANYTRLEPLCAKYGVPLIEDAAEALGATWNGKPAGGFGAFGVFSFNGNKIITTSGGGMLVGPDKGLIDKARFLATQARDPAPHYQHSHVGYNYRLSNLLAAVGRGQLRVLDERIAARRRNRAFYEQAFANVPGIRFMPVAAEGTWNGWLTVIVVDSKAFGATREQIRIALEQQNIESRPVWKPMHLQPVFAQCPMRGGAVSAAIFEDGLCLPSGSSLTTAELERVASLVLSLRSR